MQILVDNIEQTIYPWCDSGVFVYVGFRYPFVLVDIFSCQRRVPICRGFKSPFNALDELNISLLGPYRITSPDTGECWSSGVRNGRARTVFKLVLSSPQVKRHRASIETGIGV